MYLTLYVCIKHFLEQQCDSNTKWEQFEKMQFHIQKLSDAAKEQACHVFIFCVTQAAPLQVIPEIASDGG